MEKDNDVPLFVYANDPIAVYIINSDIFHLEKSGAIRNTSGYASYLLSKLSKNESVRAEFPRKIMEKQAEYKIIANERSKKIFGYIPKGSPSSPPCLTGYLHEYNHCQCLALRADITEIYNETFVKFSNFAMMNGHGVPTYTVDKFPGEFLLNLSDTFILLANLIATTNTTILFHGYYKEYKEYHRKHLREYLINYFKEKKQKKYDIPFYPSSAGTAAFCLNYFEFLEQELLSGQLTPYRILKHSGPMIINQLSAFMLKPEIITNFIDFTAEKLVNEYNMLSINNRVMFITLHLLADSFEHSYKSTIMEQYKKAVFKKVLREYSKPFAKQPRGVKEDKSIVMKRYEDTLPPNYNR